MTPTSSSLTAGKSKEAEQGRVDKELANVRMAFASGKMTPCVVSPPLPFARPPPLS